MIQGAYNTMAKRKRAMVDKTLHGTLMLQHRQTQCKKLYNEHQRNTTHKTKD